MKCFIKLKAILSVAVVVSIIGLHEPIFTAAAEQDYLISPSKVFVDGKKVDYPVDLIVKNGTTLVPLRETFEVMGANVLWSEAEKSVQAAKGNREITLKIGSNQAFIDKSRVDLIEPATIYKGKTMVPLRFVGEAFNGVVDFNTGTKVINITMPKFTVPFLTKEQGNLSNIKNVEKVTLSNNRRLMVSDNPETLDATTVKENNATLWNDVVKESRVSVDHRVVGWHMNEFNQEVTVGITIENLSGTNTIEVRNAKGIHKISAGTSEYNIGLPITEAVLNEQLGSVKVEKRGDSFLLGTFTLKPGQMVGFLNDFTIVKTLGTGELNYVIRTVVSKDKSSLTGIKSLPVPIDQIRPHARGVWESTGLVAALPAYNAGQGAEQSYNLSNGVTDNIFHKDNSLVTNAASLSNIGHYGAVYKVRLPYVNPSREEKTIRVRVGSRGGTYSGTVKTEKGVFNIPTLQPMKDVVTVIERKVTDEEGLIEFEFMHAGGAYLPISVNVTTVK